MSSKRSTAVHSSAGTTPKTRAVVTEITADIYQVTIPLPFRLNHIHSYLLRAASGWAVVDFGLNWPDAHTAWQTAFSTLEIHPTDITRLYLTHMHPDHFGMAGWFQEQTGCAVECSVIAQDQIQQVWVNHAWKPNSMSLWWHRIGIPEQVSSKARERAAAMRDNTYPHPTRFKTIKADDSLHIGDRAFRTIHAPGHAEGQLLLYDESSQLLLSGDHVLRKITPNIGVWPTGSPNPLDKYLSSLRSLQSLPVQLALPGHMGLIHDWAGRIQEIIDHHDLRLAQTLDATASQATGYDVCKALFQVADLSPHEVRFAAAEAMAHLVYLESQGQITKVSQGDGSVDLYQRL